jgi:hypothetical protein
MATINLERLSRILDEADRLAEELDGKELDDRVNLPKQVAREQRIERSRDLQQLAHLLELGAALVRNEYWHARGGQDMIYDRKDQK